MDKFRVFLAQMSNLTKNIGITAKTIFPEKWHFLRLKGKIKVNVLIFGRPTSVELEDTQVKK